LAFSLPGLADALENGYPVPAFGSDFVGLVTTCGVGFAVKVGQQ
jgi:hypothetical protein